jgi:SAM-dependent methyltransferase
MTPFNEFVLNQLPPPPGRVLELGCGTEGGIVEDLAAAGYDALGVDPRAPEGPRFLRVTLEELDDEGPFVAVVASRVLHHVDPLAPGIEKLARSAPLLVLDEFAPEKIDAAAQEWYERQHRALRAAGHEPPGPPRLDEWRDAHRGLHPSPVLLAALRERYEEMLYEERPYLYRWLGGVATASLEQTLVDTGAIPPIGFRWCGTSNACAAPTQRARWSET